MISNQVVALVTWREPTKGTKKYEYLSTQNNSVSTGISEENPRETPLVKLLLNKHLLNITGMEEEIIRLHAHLRRIRERLALLVRK